MPAPLYSREVSKKAAPQTFKTLKSTTFSESSRPSIVPAIKHIAWSPTGTAIANTTASHVRIWNPEKNNIKSSQELKGHTSTVQRLAWNPHKENELASTASDSTVKIWDVRIGSIGGGNKSVTSPAQDINVGGSGLFLTWHPNGNEILCGRSDDVLVPIDLRMGVSKQLEAAEPRQGKRLGMQTNQCSFSNSGRELFATMTDGTVRILDWPSMQTLYTLNGHTSAALAVQHSPNGSCVAVGGGDSLVTLWDTTDWVCRATFSGLGSAVNHLGFSFDGTYIATGGPTMGIDKDKDAEKGLEIVHVESAEVVHKFDTVNAVGAVAWHPLRYWIAYAGDPGGIKILGAGSNI